VVGSPTESDAENRVGDQDIGTTDRPVSSGLQVLGESGALSSKNKTPLGDLRAARRFSFEMFVSCASNDEYYSALIVWPFGR
jgi:hypothetical protein